MTDPRAALATLVSTLEHHLSVVAARRGDDDPAIDSACSDIIAAFDAYDDALFDSYGEVTPLDVYTDDEMDDEDDDDLDDLDDYEDYDTDEEE